MEYWGKKTYQTCVDPALQVLEQIDLPEYPPDLKNPIQTMYLDLRFFKMFFWGLAYQEDSSEKYRHLRRLVRTMILGFRKKAKKFEVQFECADDAERITNWESMSYHVRKRIEHYKQRAKEVCILFLQDGAFKCKPCQNKNLFLDYAKETASFIDLIQENLRLLDSFIDMTPLVKQQIAFLEGKLKVFGMFAKIVTDTSTGAKRLGEELISQTQTWANHVSCLACLYWVDDEMDESLASSMGSTLSDLMQKYMACTPEVIALYFDVLIMAPRCDEFQSEGIPQLLVSYVDFLLEHLVTPTKDDVEILREGLIFLLSFVTDQHKPDSNGNELIFEKIYSIISEFPSVICIPETNLYGFLNKMERIKVEVGDMYSFTPLSPRFNSPRTNAKGFLDSLLEKLKEMLEGKVNFIPSVKDQIKIIQEELESVKPFLHVNLELENGHEELKEVCIQIVNLVHFAAYVTNLCLTTSFSLWYGIICLLNVKEDIKLVKSKVGKIEYDQLHGNKMFSSEMKSNNALLTQATTSKNEGHFIGFEEDVSSILDHLLRGRKDLTIISISGMPGQGKTTLAKRIYNDPSVQHHFHKLVWCYVSKEPKTRELLAGIVCDVTSVDVNPETQDLSERLRKSLKGKRYLIVFYDIWDVELWWQVQMSFPDDSNGSRILFTSRNHELASQAKPNSISHPHRLFSDEESLELMKGKLFNEDGFPPQFLEIGRRIAVYCEGLPLAVALIASHLKRTTQISEWMQVERDLNLSHPAIEGCMHVIELSYKYLADHLKPCFLYFVAFGRGDIRAKELKQLWIAEGFVKENELKCSEDLAKEYLDDLVSLSLVVVTESSMRGIKSCNLHDLLYDLCLQKAVEDNFLHFVDESNTHQKYDFHHRVCVNVNEIGVSIPPKLMCTRKELPVSQTRSLLSLPGFLHLERETYESFCSFLSRFKVVTVLDLGNYVIRAPKFPKVIVYNIHLRYLSLRGFIESIPPSIVDLRNLETLIVK